MKYFIDEDFNVIGKGDIDESELSDGDFIYDDAEETDNKAIILGIAEANSLNIGTDKQRLKILNEKLNNELKTLKVITMTEETTETKVTEETTETKVTVDKNYEKVKEIVSKGIEEEKSDDEIIILIVQSGVGYKAAIRYFTKAMQEVGNRISPKERKQAISNILIEKEFEPENYEQVEEVIKEIVSTVNDTNRNQAITAIRKWCKDNDVKLPKKTGTITRTSFKSKTMDWMVANPGATDAELATYIKEQGKKEAVVKRFTEMFTFAKTFTKAVFDVKKAKAEETKGKAS